MSTFSHHPSTGQKLLARLSSLSLRSDHRSKSYSPSHRRRKQHRPRFETVLEPEEYILGLGKRLDEMHTASPVVKVSKSAGNPRISDCSTLVGVPNSPLDHEDYGHLPVKYKITNPDEPIMHFIELDGVPEPQACDKLWEVLAPQISETDGTISLKSTVNDNGVELHGYCEVSARPSLMGTGLPAAAQSLPPYPMTPPPDPEADPRREVMPTALCDRYRQQPQPSPSHLPPIHPPAITTVLSPAVPSTTYAHTEIPPSLRPGGGRMEPVMPQEPHLARHFDRSCSPREPGVLVGTSTARPPVPSKPKTFRPSAENESSTLPPLRRPLQSSFPKDHYRRPRSYKSPDDVSQGFSPAFKESREHRPQEARQSHRDPLSHTRSGKQARRGPPVPPKRFNTVIDSRRLPGPATTYQGDPRSKLHKRQETRSNLVAPCLEPLVPQLSADINANDYETLIRGLAGKEVYGTSTNAKDPRKSRHQRHTAHENLPRTGNYLEPNAGASTKRNSRSDVSLGKLEDEIRTSCHVPTSKSSEDVQDILDKAGIPPLVRAVAAAYPVLACALVNARSVAAEKDNDVTFSSTLAVVGGSSRDRRDSGPAMPSARDGAAYGAEGISTKDFGPEATTPSHHHKSTLVLSELSLLPERSSSKGKDKAMDALAIPGSWNFDNVASPANVPEARTKTSSPASARQFTSQSIRSPTIQRICDACAEDLSITEFSSYTLTSACGHENSACRPCVQHWIEMQLDDKMWNRITCMQCPEVLAYADIRRHATTETLARYDYLATRALLSEDENFKWCLGPGCESGQVHEGGNAAPLFVCEACGYRFCVIHEEPHEGETCGQYEARLNGEPFEPSDHMEATGSAQVDVEARRQQEARDLAKAQALHGRYKREEAVRQSELREARERARRAHKQAQADQIAADEETARDIQAELNGEPRDKKRTSAWVEQQREAQTRQAARDEALAREVERMEAEQHARDRVEAAARQQLRERMEQKAQEKKAQDQKALEKAQLVAQRAAEEKARLAAARAKETAQKKAAAKKAADDLVAKRKRREEEIAGAATVRQVSKQCPSCNWSIQKSQGCNHMTCWKCKHEFCYECLADHKEILRNDNSRHKKSCGYYA